jgi:hypothetical protein
MFGCCLYVGAVIGGAGAGCLRPNSGAYGYALQAALWRVGLPAVPDRRYARRRGVRGRPRWHAGTEGKYRQRQRFPMPFGTPLGAQPVVAREPGRRRPKRRSPPGTRIGPELCVGGTPVMLWGTDIRVRPGARVLRSGAPEPDLVVCCRSGVVVARAWTRAARARSSASSGCRMSMNIRAWARSARCGSAVDLCRVGVGAAVSQPGSSARLCSAGWICGVW